MHAGLGLYEYMLLAEVLKAEPVWVINAGVAHQQDIPTSQIAPWIQVNAAHAPAEAFTSLHLCKIVLALP